MHMRTVKLFLGLAATLFFLMPAAIQAADNPPPLTEMWVMTPKQESSSEFYEALAEHVAFRTEKGDPRAWQTYLPVLGDDLSRAAIRYCCFTWSEQDAYDEWTDGAKEVSEHFSKHVAPHVASYEHYFETIDWSNSHWSEEGGPYRFFAVTEFRLKAGKAGQFDAARDEISQIALNQGWATSDHNWIWSSTIGGSPMESIVIPHENYASMDQGDESFMKFLSKRLGSADAARDLMQRISDATWSSDFQIWWHHKELSMKQGD